MITLDLIADRAGLDWAQRRITAEHYLHAPIDPRCRPLVYIAHHHATWGAAAAAGPRAIAILIFGRPEAQRCYTGGLTYGSQDIETWYTTVVAPLTTEQDADIRHRAEVSRRSQRIRARRIQLELGI
jgi:hypothetical protein